MRYSIAFLVFVSIPLYTTASFLETPVHGSVPPYSIVTSITTAHQSEIFTVRIKSVLSELNVGGFTVHAHSTSEPNKFLGRFIASSAGLQLSSLNGDDNIATYRGYGEDEVQLQWQDPNDYVGEILFNATVLQDYEKFFDGITSAPVEIVPLEAVTLKSYFTSSTVRSNQSTFAKQRNILSIYDGFGTTKTCFGFPSGCIETQSCQAIASAVTAGNRYYFELQSFDALIAYVALGLSRDVLMGDDSVMECVNEAGSARAYTSYNNRRGNTREGVPQNIISVLDASFVDGLLYCKIERQSVTTVLGVDFDLPIENYHFLLAIGTTLSNTLLQRHDLARIASTQPLEIIARPADNSIYIGCGSTKTCFGLPDGCVALQSCQAVATATIVDNRHQFELESSAAQISFIALALSRDMFMGNDSVMECIRQNNAVNLHSSWLERRSIYRNEVPQNIVTLRNSSFVDGTIYCRFDRDSVTTVRENSFNLLTEDFYFLLAIGTTLTETDFMLTRHDLGRLSSPAALEIIRPPSIYDGCGTNKTCFGVPAGCIATRTCQAIVTVLVEDDERFEFEMQSGVASVGYVSFALSEDELMGDDSVIECVASGGNVSAFHSWNNPRTAFTNTRVNVSQDIFTVLSSSYTDGTIICKVEREPSTVVRDRQFNLKEEEYYYLLAIGSTFTADAIGTHNLGRWASEEKIDLRPPGSASQVIRISAISLVAWLLATSFSHFLREL